MHTCDKTGFEEDNATHDKIRKLVIQVETRQDESKLD